MLFLVPDQDSQNTESNPPSGKATIKVELDLDDAPFLDEPVEEEKPEKPDPAPSSELVPQEEESENLSFVQRLKQRLFSNKKKVVMAGGAAFLLIIAAIVVNIFLFGEDKPEVAPVEPEGPKKVVISDTPEELPPPPEVYMVKWEPFMVERRGSEGEIRILYCEFSTPTHDPMLQAEIFAKKIILRDAIYYYFNNKDLTFLSNAERQKELRSDVISVINEHITSGRVTELYFEEYVVRGI